MQKARSAGQPSRSGLRPGNEQRGFARVAELPHGCSFWDRIGLRAPLINDTLQFASDSASLTQRAVM